MKFIYLIFSVLLASNLQADAKEDNLIFGIDEDPPFVIVDDGVAKGLSLELWDAVADSLSIKYTVVMKDNGEHDIALRKMNLAVAPLVAMSDTWNDDFSSEPFYISAMAVATVKKTVSPWVAFFENLFSVNFLKMIVFLVVLNMVVGFLVWIVERKSNNEFPAKFKGIGDGFWWSWVTMTTVGYGDKVPATGSGRMIAAVWMLASVLVVSGFTAAASSELTARKIYNNVNSFADLHKMKVGCLKDSNTSLYLNHKGIKTVEFQDVGDGVGYLLKGYIDAFVDENASLAYFLAKQDASDVASLMITDLPNNREYYCFTSPNPLLIQKINPYLLAIVESPQWFTMLKKYGLNE